MFQRNIYLTRLLGGGYDGGEGVVDEERDESELVGGWGEEEGVDGDRPVDENNVDVLRGVSKMKENFKWTKI